MPSKYPIILPDNMSFAYWVNQTRLSFPKENIPIPPPTHQWHQWANYIKYLTLFRDAPVPTKSIYPNDESWRDWVLDLYKTS